MMQVFRITGGMSNFEVEKFGGWKVVQGVGVVLDLEKARATNRGGAYSMPTHGLELRGISRNSVGKTFSRISD
jgi:hypothetical protein